MSRITSHLRGRSQLSTFIKAYREYALGEGPGTPVRFSPKMPTTLHLIGNWPSLYTPLHVYLGCVCVVIYVKYITYEGLLVVLHNTLALDVDAVQEACIQQTRV